MASRSPVHSDNEYSNEGMPLRGSANMQELDDKMDIITRHAFIRKVFGIVGAMLSITAGISTIFVANKYELAKVFQQPQYQILLGLAMFLPLIMICYSYCNPSILREYPKNYMFIGLYTLCFSVIVGMSVMFQPVPIILLAVGITAVIVISLTIFAMQTTYDFSGAGPYLFTAFICLFITTLLVGCLSSLTSINFQPFQMILSGLGAMLFSFFIVYDVQLISGGKHQQVRFGLDEYAFAALVLYMDIINLFLHILSLIGDRRN